MGILGILIGIGFFGMFVMLYDGVAKGFGNRGRTLKRQHQAAFRKANHRQTPATRAIAKHRADAAAARVTRENVSRTEVLTGLAELQREIESLRIQASAVDTAKNAWADTVRKFASK